VPTKLITAQHYTASPSDLFALFGDRSFVQARLEASGGLNPEVVSLDASDDGGLDIITRQGIPASVLPSIVSSFISGDLSTQRTESWRAAADGYTADLTVTIHGAPASLKGTITLISEGDGSLLTVNADAHVPIPMFGGRIEKVIVEQVTDLFDQEEKFTHDQLAG
jgi:hypothetical protein